VLLKKSGAALSSSAGKQGSQELGIYAGLAGGAHAERPERQGRNPATGEPITIAASELSFAPAKAVRDALNQTPTKNAAKAA